MNPFLIFFRNLILGGVLIVLVFIALSLLILDTTEERIEEIDRVEDVIEEVETSIVNSDYAALREEYELFGKWQIHNTITDFTYLYEIYKNEDKYKGVVKYPESDYEIKELKVEENRYIELDNCCGEYMMIDSNKNMSLYDEFGLISGRGSGYVISKK